jgi:hypothetical protein
VKVFFSQQEHKYSRSCRFAHIRCACVNLRVLAGLKAPKQGLKRPIVTRSVVCREFRHNLRSDPEEKVGFKPGLKLIGQTGFAGLTTFLADVEIAVKRHIIKS